MLELIDESIEEFLNKLFSQDIVSVITGYLKINTYSLYNNEKIEQYKIPTHCDCCVIIKKFPTNIDKFLPILKYTGNKPMFEIQDKYDIINYFLCPHYRIGGINIEHNNYKCDYCGHCVGYSDHKIKYMLCYLCNKKMCGLCFIERKEEDAIKNGAKNWHSRKDMLLNCFSHESNIIKVFYKDDNVTEFCILDWIPVISAHCDHDVFYNINKDSVYYHKVCLAACYEEINYSYYISELSLKEVLNELNLLEIMDDQKKGYDDEDDDDNNPICKFLINNGIEINCC
jgi:hypothetical protein